ncbi:Transposon Tf2-11 polyprotein [Dictyocoela muelleri]|nr:Transposon Tf2-11 polyprotein [Dictyocoela muelleri]
MGSTVAQKNKIIGIFSKCLSPTQLRYSIAEKEMLAIVSSLLHFKNIIYGCKIKIFTDCRNITTNKTFSISKRIDRWKVLIEDFDYEFVHLKGIDNKAADYLSRVMLSVYNENQHMTAESIQIVNKIKNIENLKDKNLIINKIEHINILLGNPSIDKIFRTFKIDNKMKILWTETF